MDRSEAAALARAIERHHVDDPRTVAVDVREEHAGHFVTGEQVHLCELADGRICYGLILDGKPPAGLGEAPMDPPHAAARTNIAADHRGESTVGSRLASAWR